MRLVCVSAYSSHVGSWQPGQEVDVADDVAEFLRRDSPGSFEINIPPKGNPEPKRKRKADPVAAMSTETETGITAPDRRARGGRKRTTKKRGGKA